MDDETTVNPDPVRVCLLGDTSGGRAITLTAPMRDARTGSGDRPNGYARALVESSA
jgi:hypothetical protein